MEARDASYTRLSSARIPQESKLEQIANEADTSFSKNTVAETPPVGIYIMAGMSAFLKIAATMCYVVTHNNNAVLAIINSAVLAVTSFAIDYIAISEYRDWKQHGGMCYLKFIQRRREFL
jgi:hypothetical protein